MSIKSYTFKYVYTNTTNFQEEYDNLISFRKINIINKHCEQHHIKPKHFFEDKEKSNEESNLVYLSHKEHFMAHYFLFEINKNNSNKKSYEAMYNAFLLTLESVKRKDISSINEYSKLYEQGKLHYYEYLENIGNEKVKELCLFIIKHGKKPYSNSKDNYEMKMGRLLSRLRENKFSNSNRRKYFKSYDKIAKFYGYHYLFEKKDQEKNTLYDISQICEFKLNNGYTPTRYNEYERKLNQLLSDLKKYKTNKKHLFLESYQMMAESYGFGDLFECKNIPVNKQSSIEEMFDYIKNNGLPTKNDIEVYLTYSNLKRKNRTKELDKKAKDIGYPFLFYNKEELRLNKIDIFNDFINKYKRPPKKSVYGDNQLYDFYMTLRRDFNKQKLKVIYIDRLKELNLIKYIKGS